MIQGFTGTPNRHLEVQVSICIEFMVAFWESPGTHRGDGFVMFLRFGMPKWEAVSRSMCLMIRGWECCLNPVAAGAITKVKNMLFI